MKNRIVTDKCYITTDEIYENIFKCPECWSQGLIQEHKFCPYCGIRIYWRLNKYNKNK